LFLDEKFQRNALGTNAKRAAGILAHDSCDTYISAYTATQDRRIHHALNDFSDYSLNRYARCAITASYFRYDCIILPEACKCFFEFLQITFLFSAFAAANQNDNACRNDNNDKDFTGSQ